VVPVALVAPGPLATEAARGVLPESVPHADAAANAGRSALLVAALTSDTAGDSAALLDATQDRLHQPYRAGVMPATAALVRRLREAGIPAVVSGAGPSVLAFLQRTLSPGGTSAPAGLDVVDSTVREMGSGWSISVLDVDRHGASIQSVTPDVSPAGGTPQ
ncbi:MAG TPA: homoserine kinase, partial [Streptosporangiaceae bacterium]